MAIIYSLLKFFRPYFSIASPIKSLFFIVLVLILFTFTSHAHSTQVTLSWEPNSEPDIAGYIVYYGNTVSRDYQLIEDAGNQTSYTATGLIDDEIYYFAVTAYTNSGLESDYSIEVVYSPGDVTEFFDDFSTDTTEEYTISHKWTSGGTGTFTYDATYKQIKVLTGNNIALQFSQAVPSLDTGTFGIDFLPTVKYPNVGWIIIRLIEDENTYYKIYNTDGYGPGSIKKVVNGVAVDSASFRNVYHQNNNYNITIDFSPFQTVVNAFGEQLVIDNESSSIMVSSFEIEIGQQDAYIDYLEYY